MVKKLIILLSFIIVLTGCLNTSLPTCGDNICTTNDFDTCKKDCERKCYYQDGEFKCTDGWYPAFIKDVDNEIKQDFLNEDNIFDYNSKEIQDIMVFDIGSTYSPKDAVEKIGKWTFDNIQYTADVSYNDCYKKSASQVVKEKEATCSTQGKVNIAVLRLLGIPARGVSGCVKLTNKCKSLSIVNGRNLPKIGKIVFKDGYAVATGNIHTWTQAYVSLDNVNTWANLENTNGEVYINASQVGNTLNYEDCINYLVYQENPTESIYCGIPEADIFVNRCKIY